ncbi:MAG: hypothetical protein HN416_15315 [Nitrospina sp.]|nr:hypothetical protein [Nitrospina sp.]
MLWLIRSAFAKKDENGGYLRFYQHFLKGDGTLVDGWRFNDCRFGCLSRKRGIPATFKENIDAFIQHEVFSIGSRDHFYGHAGG